MKKKIMNKHFRVFVTQDKDNEDLFFDILDYADGSKETQCPRPCVETKVECRMFDKICRSQIILFFRFQEL